MIFIYDSDNAKLNSVNFSSDVESLSEWIREVPILEYIAKIDKITTVMITFVILFKTIGLDLNPQQNNWEMDTDVSKIPCTE